VHVSRTAGTWLALLTVLAIGAMGNLAWSGGAMAAPRTGTLIGTASPCTGLPRTPTSPLKTWRVQVVLHQGKKVVGRRTVIDSWRSGRATKPTFTFRVSAGTYVVSSPYPPHRFEVTRNTTVIIEAGKTTKVTLPNICD
jgi:hypothetical protein